MIKLKKKKKEGQSSNPAPAEFTRPYLEKTLHKKRLVLKV
jgi:hypothetical protein